MQEPGMATKTKPINAHKAPVKRKVSKDKLTYADVPAAAKGGDEVFEYFAENGKLPVR